MLAVDMHAWAPTMLALASRPPDPQDIGDACRDTWLQRLDAVEPFIHTTGVMSEHLLPPPNGPPGRRRLCDRTRSEITCEKGHFTTSNEVTPRERRGPFPLDTGKTDSTASQLKASWSHCPICHSCDRQ
jgi:hypothetical protein